MWIALLCGLVVYKFLRLFFSDDDLPEVETSDSDAIFAVASRIEKIYGGKAYVGLRIPDADSGSRQNIDVVLVTKREAVVISVKNFSGFVAVKSDGSWVCMSDHKHKEEHHLDPVADARRQLRTLNSDYFPPEVIPYEQWVQLKPDSISTLSGWIKGAFCTGKKEMQESIQKPLHFVLSTAPMCDRLELKGNRYLLGEFLEFKGKHEDVQALQFIKRSKVDRLIVQKMSMFGLAPKKLQVLYSPRDYRTEGGSASEWKEVTVRSSTEFLFQPRDSKKVSKIKLSSVTSVTLSA
ncbi:hypothetical protein Nepgr_031366 [Nepenthes gracilis]|uniref:NERD domain-containing protein n=1 Tax=Nepenthes gracilis TaxID=150966 RepID=A0AAD3TGE3_NEPGR|nr:hypothetical protein Nepgr_031366 [Nepenthes gracilis]